MNNRNPAPRPRYRVMTGDPGWVRIVRSGRSIADRRVTWHLLETILGGLACLLELVITGTRADDGRWLSGWAIGFACCGLLLAIGRLVGS